MRDSFKPSLDFYASTNLIVFHYVSMQDSGFSSRGKFRIEFGAYDNFSDVIISSNEIIIRYLHAKKIFVAFVDLLRIITDEVLLIDIFPHGVTPDVI